ncbi:MAG TPA: penicillin-binding protein 1B [Gammaproteobacteria bacterium]|nr:penicillin-binding protein 1B [Gammaproteobacteria bacterium]
MPRTPKRKSASRKKAARKSTTGKKPAKKSAKRPRRPANRHAAVLKRLAPLLAAGLTLALVAHFVYLDAQIRRQFEGRRWALPATVYARPLELYPGRALTAAQLTRELGLAGYRPLAKARAEGSFSRRDGHFEVMTRAFRYWDGAEPARRLLLQLRNGRLAALRDGDSGEALDIVRLQPAVIGRIYPAHHEDRRLVRLQDVPDTLIRGLIAMEDRAFYRHHGLDPRAMLRALWADLRAGRLVQGGSTLTQQLVKNFFLSNRRSLWRKFNEAGMALLLEWHYGKDEILEAYLNEIYLGQDGRRAIHGFGLASRYYFDRPLAALKLEEIATLIALVRGPSYYDPRRHPGRLRERRDRVLSVMAAQGIVSRDEAGAAMQQPLRVVRHPRSIAGHYPAFMDLVRRQLRHDYRPEDLRAEGLRIFTSLDPALQQQVEQAAELWLERLDRRQGLDGKLQAAIVLSDTASGEVLALLGDRRPRYAGYNRALDAARPIGSLIKPAVYLTALQAGYSFASLLDDTPLTVQGADGTRWSPRNYDGRSHGQVPLITALIRSYNQATVRLGMALGFEAIADTLQRLGVSRPIPPYPSMLLGAVDLTPWEVAGMYQTLAAGGFRTPLRAVRAVLSADGRALKRFPVAVRQTLDGDSVAMLKRALYLVTRLGTARALRQRLPALAVAGKTGTTNDLRDSWFAGFSASRLAVVWLGQDDNRPVGLSGAGGALQVWAELMGRIPNRSLSLPRRPALEYHWLDLDTGRLSAEGCENAAWLPFRPGSAPTAESDCVDDDMMEGF